MSEVQSSALTTKIPALLGGIEEQLRAMLSKASRDDVLSFECRIQLGNSSASSCVEIPVPKLVLLDPAGGSVVPLAIKESSKDADSMLLDEIIECYEIFSKSKVKRGRIKTGPSLKTINRNISTFRNFIERHRLVNKSKKDVSLATCGDLKKFIKGYDFIVELEARKQLRAQGKKYRQWNAPLDETGGFKSMLRRCSAVFSEKFRSHLAKKDKVELNNPFDEFDTQSELRPYQPPAGGQAFWMNLADKLYEECDALMICMFLICYSTGLRLQEAAHLKWGDLRVSTRNGSYFLHVRSDEIHETKAYKYRDIPIAKAVYDFLCSCRPKNSKDTDWLIPDERKLRNENRDERCHGVSARLRAWLKSNGVDSPMPIHTLRKQYGSEVSEKQSIYVASRLLGHSSVKVTEEVYVSPLSEQSNEVPVPQASKHYVLAPKTRAKKTQKKSKLEKAKALIVATLKSGPASPKELLIKLNLSRSTMKRALQSLTVKGAVIQSGTTRAVQYKLKK